MLIIQNKKVLKSGELVIHSGEISVEIVLATILRNRNPFSGPGESHYIIFDVDIVRKILNEWVCAAAPSDNDDRDPKGYSGIKPTQVKNYADYQQLAIALLGAARSERLEYLKKEERYAWDIIENLEIYEEKIIDPLIERIGEEIKEEKLPEEIYELINKRAKYSVYDNFCRPLKNFHKKFEEQKTNLSYEQFTDPITLNSGHSQYRRENHVRLILKLAFIDDYTRTRRVEIIGVRKLKRFILPFMYFLNTYRGYQVKDLYKKCIMENVYGDYRIEKKRGFRGGNAWTLLEKNPYIQHARKIGIPLQSGPSSTAAFLLFEARKRGFNDEALLYFSWAIFAFFHIMPTVTAPTHTFHEVMMAAKSIVPNMPYNLFQYPDQPPHMTPVNVVLRHRITGNEPIVTAVTKLPAKHLKSTSLEDALYNITQESFPKVTRTEFDIFEYESGWITIYSIEKNGVNLPIGYAVTAMANVMIDGNRNSVFKLGPTVMLPAFQNKRIVVPQQIMFILRHKLRNLFTPLYLLASCGNPVTYGMLSKFPIFWPNETGFTPHSVERIAKDAAEAIYPRHQLFPGLGVPYESNWVTSNIFPLPNKGMKKYIEILNPSYRYGYSIFAVLPISFKNSLYFMFDFFSKNNIYFIFLCFALMVLSKHHNILTTKQITRIFSLFGAYKAFNFCKIRLSHGKKLVNERVGIQPLESNVGNAVITIGGKIVSSPHLLKNEIESHLMDQNMVHYMGEISSLIDLIYSTRDSMTFSSMSAFVNFCVHRSKPNDNTFFNSKTLGEIYDDVSPHHIQPVSILENNMELKLLREKLSISHGGLCKRMDTKVRDFLCVESFPENGYKEWRITGTFKGAPIGRDLLLLPNGWYTYVITLKNEIRYLPTHPKPSAVASHDRKYTQLRSHSQLAENKNVYCAGAFLLEDGEVRKLDPGSGHYRPEKSHLMYAREVFEKSGIPIKDNAMDFELFQRYRQSIFMITSRYMREVGKVVNIVFSQHSFPDEPAHLSRHMPK